MQITLESLRQTVQTGRITKANLMRQSGLDWKTVNNALLQKRRTHPSTLRVLLDAANTILAGDIPVQSNNPDPETFANLATAQAEHRLLTEMALETARLEIAPETTTALERLRELVRVQGKRNQYGHKQYKNIILNGGLLELTDDEPEVISETRAAQILEGA
jgi:hypothetical protein